MPIRFRCPHCTRLLGIAKRKAGTQISCPQCGKLLTVPRDDGDSGDDVLDEIDVLLNPMPGAAPLPKVAPRPGAPKPYPPPTLPPQPERPRVTTAPVRPQPQAVAPLPLPEPWPLEPDPPPPPVQRPRPQPPRKPAAPPRESPLLENDVDALLGLQRPGSTFELDDAPAPRKQPVSGPDAMSLGDDVGGLHLSPQKATLLAVAVMVLMGIAFAAGYLIASNT